MKGANEGKLIATIPKNAREVVRVTLSEFEGRQMFSARTFYDDGSGEYLPGRNGLTLKAELLLALVSALQEAEAVARAARLLSDAGQSEGDGQPDLTIISGG